MSRRSLIGLLAACALTLLWLLLGRSIPHQGLGFLFLAPALLLALPLLTGRYIGAERLTRIAARALRREHPSSSDLMPRSGVTFPPRGGLLIAFSLAVRPPPALVSL